MEALVALALFQIAMLALAATTVVAARDLASAARRSRALALATNGAEMLRVGACTSPSTSGRREAPGGLTEIWRVDVSARGRVVTDSVVFALSSGRVGQVVARRALLCPT